MSYIALATTTLSSAVTSVTFSSIPATYKDLIVVFRGGASQNSYCGMQLNGDSASNYSYVEARFEVNGVFSEAGSNVWVPQRFTGTSDTFVTYQIMDYAATDKQKTVLVRNGKATESVYMAAARWANTNAVTSLTLDVEGSRTWNVGSTFSLYGVA